MTSAERRQLLPFLREVVTGPVRSTAMQAKRLLERFSRERRPVTPWKIEKAEKRLSRRDLRAKVRAACVVRAGGKCECCGLLFTELNPAEWDEFYGRKHVTVEETWMLRRSCHREKTENWPDRKIWDRLFREHCARHGYPFRARLTKTIARRPQQGSESRMERVSRGPAGFSSSRSIR